MTWVGSYRGYLQYVASIFWRLTFFSNAVDLFSIYKQDYKKPTTLRLQYYLNEGLRLARQPSDRYRAIWQRCLSVAIVYLSSRHLMCIIAQVGIYSPLVRSKHTYMVQKLKQLEYMIGDPLCGTSSISVAVYCMLVTSLMFIIYLSNIYRRTPINASLLRFMLDPERELRRVNLTLEEQLTRLKVEARFHIQSPRSINKRLLKQLMASFGNVRSSAKMIPGMFDEQGYENIWTLFLILIPVTLAGAISLAIHLYYLFIINIKYYCQEAKNLNECYMKDVYKFQHFISIAEICTSTFMTGGSFVLVLFGAVASIFGQLISIAKLNEHLANLRFIYATSNIKGASISLNSRLTMDISALVSLIKFRLSNQEFNYNTILLSQLIAPLIACSWTGMIVVVLTGKFPGFSGTRYYRISFLFFTWTIANAILILCAYSHARSLDLEKLAYNVMGHIHSRYLWDAASYKNGLVLELWQRLVLALGENRHPVTALGLTITYHQVLRLNFFIVSILSLIY